MWLRLLLPLASAAVLAALDVRRRPVLAGAAYGIALVVLYGWSIGRSPAFAPLVPSAAETAAALAIAAAGGLIGALAGRRLADALEPRPASAPLDVLGGQLTPVRPDVTSPGR